MAIIDLQETDPKDLAKLADSIVLVNFEDELGDEFPEGWGDGLYTFLGIDEHDPPTWAGLQKDDGAATVIMFTEIKRIAVIVYPPKIDD